MEKKATKPSQRRGSTKTAQAAIPAAREPALASPPVTAAAASGDGSTAFSPAERLEMIATAAYRRAEQRGFSGGAAEQDWLEAEAEIDRELGRRHA